MTREMPAEKPISDYARSLLAARPDHGSESFVARRILKHFGLSGKAAEEKSGNDGHATLFDYAKARIGRRINELWIYPQSPLHFLEIYATAVENDDTATMVEHLVSLACDNAVLLFVRGRNDVCHSLLLAPRKLACTHSIFDAPVTLLVAPEMPDMLIYRRTLDSFMAALCAEEDR